MISLRNSGDIIAGEFSRLVDGLQQLKKEAGLEDFAESPPAEPGTEAKEGTEWPGEDADDGGDAGAIGADADDDTLNAADFLVDHELQADDGQAAAAIDGAVEAMSAVASVVNPSGMYIMNGLGKIAAGLRRKGEGFAADMVEATALSISGDLKKEAEEKSGVIDGLKALAAEFDAEKDTFAGDMVRATISNIVSG